jgi:predicted O-methyltransferase YrrM
MNINLKSVVDETIDMYSPMQVYEELVVLTTFLARRGIINALEIGSHRFGLLNIIAKIASGKIISIDSHHSDILAYKEHFLGLYPTARLLEGDSHDSHTKSDVIKTLDDEKLDLLVIDGDHSFDGVTLDFDMYSQLVDRNGIIVFHDVDPQHALLTEPARAWQLLKTKSEFESGEIIYPGITSGIEYFNRIKLYRITDLLYRHPTLYRERFPALRGLPCRCGGFGILRKIVDNKSKNLR